jgi:hypothetical protein
MASKKTRGSPSESLQNEQLEDEIRETARKLYEERCAQNIEGDEQSDWLRAEQLVKNTHSRE